MKHPMNYLLLTLLALLPSLGFAQVTLQSTLPGDGLQWETSDLTIAVSVMETSLVTLEVYSPGFDPEDYRSEGELGDERYDGASTPLETTFTLKRDGRVVSETRYGLEQHRSVVLFEGELEPGEYILTSSFSGLAKNTFVYTLSAEPEGTLFVELLETQLYNVERGPFQKTFFLEIPGGEEPVTVELYDGDSAAELAARVKQPDGTYQMLEVSGDKSWLPITLAEPGLYGFEFFVPEGAYQYTNTIGVRVDKRLLVDGNVLRAFSPQPVYELVKTVDKTEVAPGDSLTYMVTVRNVGGAIGTATLEDRLPEGLVGADLVEELSLPAGASRTFEVSARVAEDAPATLVNTVRLLGENVELVDDAPVRVIQVEEPLSEPAAFKIDKQVTPEVAQVGDTVTYTLIVTNVGGTTGKVALADVLPRGLAGSFETQVLELAPGSAKTIELTGTVQENAPDLLINRAAISDLNFNRGSARADVRVEREPARFTLTKTVDKESAEVGDRVRFLLTVTNVGEQMGEATLEDALPVGLSGENLLETFSLAPGQSRTFAVNAVVNGDATERVLNEARLSSAAGEVVAAAAVTVERPEPEAEPTPEVEAAPEPQAEPLPEFELSRFSRIDLFYQVDNVLSCDLGTLAADETVTLGFTYRLQNATPEQLFERSATNGLSVEPLPPTTENGETSVRVRVTNSSSEPIENAVLVEPLPAGAELVGASHVCSDLAAQAESILLTHTPPAGSAYDTGSARASGEPAPDPFQDETGRLYFVLPYASAGSVSYLARHTDVLPPVAPPTLTLRTADRDIFLVGRVPFGSLAQTPAEPVEGVAGAGVEVRPIAATADGRNPLTFELRAFDAEGDVADAPYLTVDTNLEPQAADAAPLASGYQVALQNGVGLLELTPIPTPTTLELTLSFIPGEDELPLRETLTFFIPGARTPFYQYQVSATVTTAGGIGIEGEARGYAEIPLGSGTLQTAVDVGATLEEGIDTERGLADEVDPTDRFPLTGAGEEAEPALRSDDGVALKYSQEAFSAGYYADPLAVPGVEGLPRATALRAETNGDLKAKGFVALLPRSTTTTLITPDGTRTYFLGEAVERSSERLTLVFSEEGTEVEVPLERLQDYTINYTTGAITLAEPLWSFDEFGNPVRLRVDYAPEGSPRDQLAYGAGAELSLGAFTFGVGAAQLDLLQLGANARYDGDAVRASVSYRVDFADASLENSQVSARADGELGRFAFGADLSYDESLRGKGRASYRVLPDGRLVLEHRGSVSDNRTALRYEQTLFDALLVGAGVDYTWETGVFGGSALLGYDSDALNVRLDHSQPFDSEERSKSTLEASYELDNTLSATAGVAYEWGNELEGTLKLTDTPSGANFALSYQLPTVSGESSRARFGVEAPWALTETLSLNLNAGYEADFVAETGTTAFGAAARYSVPTFTATLGAEVSLPSEGDTKVVVRSGASGQLGKDQTLSADVNYQIVPDALGSFGVAYALKTRDLNLLTYHRLEQTLEETVLRGELAPTWYPSNHFQLRPHLAYRVKFNDPVADTYQASLFGTYYFDLGLGGARDEDPTFVPYSVGYRPTFGLGAGIVYLLQPGTDAQALGFNVEASAQVIDPLWLTLGYMFDQDFGGLTPETVGGLYFRVDLVGGGL